VRAFSCPCSGPICEARHLHVQKVHEEVQVGVLWLLLPVRWIGHDMAGWGLSALSNYGRQ
jgi:hypothetical protein